MVWKDQLTRCVCSDQPDSPLALFHLERSQRGTCSQSCQEQFCGISGGPELHQSVAVFQNAHYTPIHSTCSQAFMKSVWPLGSDHVLGTTHLLTSDEGNATTLVSAHHKTLIVFCRPYVGLFHF